MIKANNKVLLGLCILLLINILLVLPESLRERLYPYDAALFAANGAFFLSIFHDIAHFISAPMDWIWDYYHQYPALFISRHPPILGIVEGVMYQFFGISTVTAKITIFLFSLFGVIGWFLAFLKMFKDHVLAFWASLLILTYPQSIALSSSVRADVPAMAFFAWAVYFVACYLESSEKKFLYAMLAPLGVLCTLYTYQLPMFGVIALFFFTLSYWKKFYKRSEVYWAILLFTLLILPLVVFNLKLGGRVIAGKFSQNVQDFVPVASRWNLDNWIYYLKMLLKEFQLPVIGLILWGLTKIRAPFRKYEVFFLLWFILGYFGFSIIPSKNDRYIFHFILPALFLTALGIRELTYILTQKYPTARKISALPHVLFILLILWNILSIPEAKARYVQHVDQAVQMVLDQNQAPRILYHGEFESVFIFYTRKYDINRTARVFRTANEIENLDNILEDLAKNDINFIAIESEDLRKIMHGGIYSQFYQNLHELLQKENERFAYIGKVPTLYGKPGKEQAVDIQIYQVNQ